jgi:hypothetical protein
LYYKVRLAAIRKQSSLTPTPDVAEIEFDYAVWKVGLLEVSTTVNNSQFVKEPY